MTLRLYVQEGESKPSNIERLMGHIELEIEGEKRHEPKKKKKKKDCGKQEQSLVQVREGISKFNLSRTLITTIRYDSSFHKLELSGDDDEGAAWIRPLVGADPGAALVGSAEAGAADAGGLAVDVAVTYHLERDVSILVFCLFHCVPEVDGFHGF